MAKHRPPGSPRPPRRPTGDYRTGYCRPPADHQFKPGQSGNRKGRPRGKRKTSLADEFDAVLAERVGIRSPEGKKSVTVGRAFFTTLVHEALSGGKPAAQRLVLSLIKARLAQEALAQQQPTETDPDIEEDPELDEELLKDFLRRHKKGEDDEAS